MDSVNERTEAILNDCGVRLPGRRNLPLPLAGELAELESDLQGRAFHDTEYCRLLHSYESALKTLRQVGAEG